MNNITKAVWNYIDLDPTIRIGLSRGIINQRALAQYILAKASLDSNTSAVLSAVRRYEENNPLRESFDKAMDLIKTTTMSSKNGIASITLEKSEIVETRLPKIFSVIDVAKHHVLRIIHADESIKLILDKKNLARVKKLFPETKILKIEENLAEVTVHMDERSWTTPGVASILTSELFSHGINIQEIMSCIPEIILFFKEKDLMNAYNVLYDIAR